jgi:hypothetical protein
VFIAVTSHLHNVTALLWGELSLGGNSSFVFGKETNLAFIMIISFDSVLVAVTSLENIFVQFVREGGFNMQCVLACVCVCVCEQ